MDENNVFPIPPKKGIGEDRAPAEEFGFIKSFENADGTKAVNLVSVEVADGEVVEKLDDMTLAKYADALFETGEDPQGLQVGGEFDSLSEAEDEADRLNDMYAPVADASDEEIVSAVEDAKADEGEAEEEDIEEEDIESEPIFGQLKEKANPFGE